MLGDTARTPYSCYGTADSRGSVTGGAAVLQATRALREKLVRVAAHLLEADEGRPGGRRRSVSRARRAGRGLSFAALAQESLRGQSLPDGIEPELQARFTYNPENWTFPYGVHVAAVEVARDTGMVRVLGYWVAHDCGTMLNPMLVDGQLHGGLAQGIGARAERGAPLRRCGPAPVAHLHGLRDPNGGDDAADRRSVTSKRRRRTRLAG